jgi:23S rRNA (cytidine1920-2'-O)/16S rRNA (cytidine1409-2'-O)-methyltransferase
MNQRLDRLMVERGLAPTRSKAQALVMAAQVFVNGEKLTKAGTLVSKDARIQVQGPSNPYVSRGGLKLDRALAYFDLNPRGWKIIDVGASTGGFTDCWLKHGAEHVWAVDVGYGQLDWQLRQDPRVTVLEKTNARWLTADILHMDHAVDAASIDASFISMVLLLQPLHALVKDNGVIVGLVKPQFEAGPEHVGKHGVVRDPKIHVDVLEKFIDQAQALDFSVLRLTFSPIRGPEGNIEFLSLLSNQKLMTTLTHLDIVEIVDQAWDQEEHH